MSIDAEDHVWVLQRPGTLEPDEKATGRAAGAGVRRGRQLPPGMGRPGRRATSGPTPSTASTSTTKGFVWIGGNGAKDHQILKFTKAGKFVMQIGQAGQSKGNADTQNLNQPADTFVHAKTNELFVADGYGNRRVIVFDADTGTFKRMWGAFGNVPTDDAAEPRARRCRRAKARRSSCSPCMPRACRTTASSTSRTAAASACRCSRIDGKYVTQVFIGRECKAPECGNGTTAASTAFSTDPEQRFLYVGNRSQAKVMVFDRKTLTRPRLVRPVGFGARRVRHAASHGGRLEGQPLRHRSHAAQPENRRIQKFQLISR